MVHNYECKMLYVPLPLCTCVKICLFYPQFYHHNRYNVVIIRLHNKGVRTRYEQRKNVSCRKTTQIDSASLRSVRMHKKSWGPICVIETPSTAFLMVSWQAVLLVGRWTSPIIKNILIIIINNNQYCFTCTQRGGHL